MIGKKIAFSLLLMTLCVALRAQVVDSMSIYDMEHIVVQGSRVTKEVVPVQTLSGGELKRLSSHSVADAMRYFSGVQIKDYGGVGGLKTINVRSMGSQHVGVFYDGVELGNAQNGVVDLGRFSLDNMESVSLYSGQKSALLQSAKDYASASAIYMTSRKPEFTDGKRYNLNLGLKGGSFKTINPSLLWEQRVTSRVRSSLSAEYLYTSGEYKFSYTKADGYDTTQMRQNGDIRYLRAETAFFGDIKSGGEWQAKAYIYDSERGFPGAVVREEPGVFKNADRQWDRNIFVQGSMRKSFGGFYNLKVSGKYAYDFLHYLSDPDLDTSTMYVDNTYRQQEAYGSVVNMFSLCRWANVALASDFQYNTLDADLVDFIYPSRYTSLTSVAASVNHRGLKMQGSLLYTYVKDKSEEVSANAGDLSEFTPTFVASYKLTKNLDLRAFYKRVFRMPTLNDLYYEEVGNKSLSPEFTNQYNIGATYRHTPKRGAMKMLELQSDIYYNEVEDKIIATPTSNQFRWTMLNLGYVEIRGVDIAAELRWLFGEFGVTSRVNYTYQKAQDFTDAESDEYGGQIPYIPWHSGSAIIGVERGGWTFNYSFIYTGERYDSVANIPENYVLPWYTSDISLSRIMQLRGCELRISAEVNNILNQQYEVVNCYPMPGINYNLKINVVL